MRNPLARLFDNRKSQTIADLVSAYLRDTPGSGRLTDDAAMRVGTFNAGTRLVAGIEASLPLHVYQRQPDGGKQRQYGNTLDRLLSVKAAGLADAEQAEVEAAFTEFLAGGWIKTLAGEREKAAPKGKLSKVETQARDAIARKFIRNEGGNPEIASPEVVKAAVAKANAEKVANTKLWIKALAQFTKAQEL
jgi:uncharacterized protein (DUF2267 family)